MSLLSHSELNSKLQAPLAGPAESPMVLLFAYGNIDRQDDGVAWHTLRAVAESFGQDLPEVPDETFFHITPRLDAIFALQLTPEDAELISKYDKVCFIDAHTGRVEDLVHCEILSAQYETSPFTHHLTATTCLAMASACYQAAPQAILTSIRGFEFGFSQELSSKTKELVPQAVQMINVWINS